MRRFFYMGYLDSRRQQTLVLAFMTSTFIMLLMPRMPPDTVSPRQVKFVKRQDPYKDGKQNQEKPSLSYQYSRDEYWVMSQLNTQEEEEMAKIQEVKTKTNSREAYDYSLYGGEQESTQGEYYDSQERTEGEQNHSQNGEEEPEIRSVLTEDINGQTGDEDLEPQMETQMETEEQNHSQNGQEPEIRSVLTEDINGQTGDEDLETQMETQMETENTNVSDYLPHLHPDRFKFIYKMDRLSREGPKVNPIPDQLTWIHDLKHIEVCEGDNPLILAVVISAIHKKDLRDFIRRTWANPRLHPYTKIRHVFIIGATTNNDLQNEVNEECDKYNDIIQYNFIDSYSNLTYKSIAWLNWATTRCPQVPFIAKIDDDVMVNPFHLRTFFEEQLETPPVPKVTPQFDIELEPGDNIATSYIYGRYDPNPYPLRDTKWGVPKEDYPERNYPPFVHGPAYVVGRIAARTLMKYVPYVPFLKLEDVYTTGLVAHAAQVKHVQIFGVVNTFVASGKLFNGTQALMEETNPKSRSIAWEGISLYAPVNITALGTPYE